MHIEKANTQTSKSKLTVPVQIVDHHSHNQRTVLEVVELVGYHSNQTERIRHLG